MQIVEVLGGRVVAQYTFGVFTTKREHEQVADAREQVLDEPARVVPADDDLLDDVIELRAIMVDDRVDRVADEHVRREPEERSGRVIGDVTVDGADHELVEHGQRVTHRTAAGAHREPQDARFGLDVLLLAYLLKIRPHRLGRNEPKRIMVGARADRADDLLRFRRREDEHDMLGWLLDDLEERVEALRRHHMRLVEDEDLVAVARGRESRAFTQLARVVDAVVACGVDLDDVDRPRPSRREVTAAVARTAWMRRRAFDAVHATREDACGTRLATAART